MGGVGAGGQVGMELTDFVFVLTTDSAVKTFMQAGSLTLGGKSLRLSDLLVGVLRPGECWGRRRCWGICLTRRLVGCMVVLRLKVVLLLSGLMPIRSFMGGKVRAVELLNWACAVAA